MNVGAVYCRDAENLRASAVDRPYSKAMFRKLVECLAGTRAPGEGFAVRSLQAQHAQAMVFRIAARVTNNDHMIAGSQCVARNALPSQLSAAAPFDGPAHYFAFFVFVFNLNIRMRIPEHELNDVPFNGLLFVLEVRCCERMVRIQLNA